LSRAKSHQADWLEPAANKAPAAPCLPAEVIRKPTILKAIEYGQECAGLAEKQVYDHLGWKKEVWSRIFTADTKNPAFFDARRLVPFMDLCGNDAPLIWLAHKRGYDWSTIRTYQTGLERENFELRQQLAEKDRALKVAADLIAGRVPK
jgi:hypothetical protein